jgi:predicted Fe-Mo cluster-binding NifX family protein
MKIAVSAWALTAKVDEHFIRYAYFEIVDLDTMKGTAFSNPSLEFYAGIENGCCR